MDRDRDIDKRLPSAIATSLRGSVEGAVVLVGTGQYSPYPEHSRTSVLRLDGDGPPSLVWDRYYPDKAIPELRDALGAFCDVYAGELDTMYATPWSLAWTIPPARFRAYDTNGLIASTDGRTARVRSPSGQRNEVPLDQIESVIAWVADDWVHRGVSLVMRGGSRIVVAEAQDLMPLVDPTYDGINLMLEAAWAAQMGKAIAKGLGVPYIAGDPALT